jgi:ABC-type phosphate transport system ATPase subunit
MDRHQQPAEALAPGRSDREGAGLQRDICHLNVFSGAWQALHNCSMLPYKQLSPALINPCEWGQLAFLRTCKHVPYRIPQTSVAGKVLLDTCHIFEPTTGMVGPRQQMVFQCLHLFPKSRPTSGADRLQIEGCQIYGQQGRQRQRARALCNKGKNRYTPSALSSSGGQSLACPPAVEPDILLQGKICFAPDPIATPSIDKFIACRTRASLFVRVRHTLLLTARIRPLRCSRTCCARSWFAACPSWQRIRRLQSVGEHL